MVTVLVFRHALSTIPRAWWADRDDGVITLSHAKNLIEFGFVGTNPSGERVEGFSSPLQFVVFAVVYAARHVGFSSYIAAQTTVCSALLGALAYATLARVVGSVRLAVVGAASVAFVLSRATTFLEWNASGLENALTHVTTTASVLILLHLVDRERPRVAWAVALVVAAITRMEGVVHIGAFVALFVALHVHRHRNLASLRIAAAFLAGWLVFFVVRAAYFHDWLPNTAYAQFLSPRAGLEHVLIGRTPRSSIDLALSFARTHDAMLVVLAAPFAVVSRNRTMRTWFLFGAGTVALVIVHAMVFGPARLDPPRTTTFLAPIAAITLAAAILSTPMPLLGRAALVAALAAPQLEGLTSPGTPPYELCCSAEGFDGVRETFAKLGTTEKLARPLVANADLGAMSFAKQFNILDLGRLGSTVFARSNDDRSRNELFLRIAQPDMVAIHGGWLGHYSELLHDPRFAALYAPVEANLWVRKDIKSDSVSDERRLIDEVARGPAAAPFERAVVACNTAHRPDGCLFVARTAYRFRPDFSRAERARVRSALAAIADAKQRAMALAWFDGAERGDLTPSVHAFLQP